MFNRLGLQLYTARDFFIDEEMANLTLKKIHDAGYTEAHTAGRYCFTPEKFNELLKNNGIQIIGTHYDYEPILNDIEGTKALHRLYGTTNIGIGGMPGFASKSTDGLKQFIKDFNHAAEEYAKDGFKLTYHNHHFEFMRIDGTKTIMDYLKEGFDKDTVSFVLDTCWVMAGCNDLCSWMEKLAGRIDILHLKDVRLENCDGHFCGTMTEVGSGFVNWDKVIPLAEQIGVKHYVVEQDSNFEIWGDPFNSIRKSADYLKKFMK